MNTITQDLKFALRQLRRSPGFALAAILTLALGIGANTAIFSLLDQALLRSLPVTNPSELVVLRSSTKAFNGSTSMNGGDVNDYFSYAMYKDLRDQNQVFSGMIASAPANAGFIHDRTSDVIDVELITTNYFDVLGVRPALGRLITASDEAPLNGNPVAVLSYDFWRTHLASDPAIVGSAINLNGHPFQVVGVAPASFQSAIWGQTPPVFIPMTMQDQVTGHIYSLTRHDARWLNILARLKPGITSTQAATAINPLWHALRAEELKTMGKVSPRFLDQFLTSNKLLLMPGARGFSYKRGNLQNPLYAVMAMAVLVLLISAVNVASLLLVRSAGRIREFSLRTALGATTARVLTQLLLEGLLIGIGGGIVGLALAPIAINVLVNRLSSPDTFNPLSTSLDLRVLAFNFAIAIAVSLLFSLAPALQLRRLNIVNTLRESSSTGSGSLLALRRIVVCVQIGLSVILLVASGLFLRSMQKLRAVDPGFDTAHLVTFDLDPTLAGFKDADMPSLHQRTLAALAAIPGIQAVAATNDTELAGNHSTGNVSVAGTTEQSDTKLNPEQALITANYLQVLGMPLVTGRYFTDADDLTHPKVAIVNQSFAKHYCGNPQACLGRMMNDGGDTSNKLDTQIVGVVRDAHHGGLREDITAGWYRPVLQFPKTDDLQFYIRHFGNPAPIVAALRPALQGIDRGLSPTGIRTMDQQIDQNLSAESLIALLALSFGILATVLAGVGLYGVLAFSTQQRTREVGIRMALGSTRWAVSSLILTDVLRLAALGVVIALPVAYGLSRLVQTQLYGVTAADPVILLSVVLIIATVAILAALLPARRAASINPTEALRTE